MSSIATFFLAWRRRAWRRRLRPLEAARPSALDAARRGQPKRGGVVQGKAGKAANRGATAADGNGEEGHGAGVSVLLGSRFWVRMERKSTASRGWASIRSGGRSAAVRRVGGGAAVGRRARERDGGGLCGFFRKSPRVFWKSQFGP